MSINPLKEFFKRRKAEVKFARAGPGQKLSSDAQPSQGTSSDQTARQAAAEAAMKRFNKDNTKPSQRPRIVPSDLPSRDQVPDQVRASEGSSIGTSKSPSQPPRELALVDGVPQRNVQVYTTEELAQRAKQPDIDDDFFRLTVEDAKLFKQRYDEERARNEILKTSEMRKRDQEARRPTTNIARLRFKLPNNMIIEASFSGSENFTSVKNWLVEMCEEKFALKLQDYDILFGLRPLKDVDMNKTVKQLQLIPATSLTVVSKRS